MMHEHLTGWAAILSAAALTLHALTHFLPALSASLPALTAAFRARAESRRLDAQTRATIEAARIAADEATRAALAKCDEDRRDLHAEMDKRGDAHAAELGRLHGMLAALREELDELRRSMTAGHGRP